MEPCFFKNIGLETCKFVSIDILTFRVGIKGLMFWNSRKELAALMVCEGQSWNMKIVSG